MLRRGLTPHSPNIVGVVVIEHFNIFSLHLIIWRLFPPIDKYFQEKHYLIINYSRSCKARISSLQNDQETLWKQTRYDISCCMLKYVIQSILPCAGGWICCRWGQRVERRIFFGFKILNLLPFGLNWFISVKVNWSELKNWLKERRSTCMAAF